MDRFKLNKLFSNCDFIKNFCLSKKCEENAKLIECCDKLIKSARLVDEIANDYILFEDVPENGFILFLRVITSFSDQIVNQIKNKNKIDPDILRLAKLIFLYDEWLMDIYGRLKKEANDSSNEKNNQNLMVRESLNPMLLNKIANANYDVLQLIFSSNYCGFWIKSLTFRIALKLINLGTALFYNFPFSLASLFNDKSLSNNCRDTFKNINLKYPFNIWHLGERFYSARILNYFINFRIPVASKTLSISRQTRFRIDYKGNILDFDVMSKKEIEAYLNDNEEQARQNAPGLRHRNKDTISCRYSYIANENEIKESLERIRKKKEDKCSTKSIKYFTTRISNNRDNLLDEQNNNYLLNSLENDSNQKNPASQRVLCVYIHGGGYFAIGSTTYEGYLRRIVNNLAGIPILSIDYSLTVPFPLPVQEILDVYLWLFSRGKDVKEALGFLPEKIVLACDSCGGHYFLSLIIAVNELNKMLNTNKSIPLPVSVVAAYPVISIKNLTPSKAITTIDSMVTFHSFLLMLSMYAANVSTNGDFKKIEKTRLFQEIVEKNQDLTIGEDNNDFGIESKDDDSPWFLTNYKILKYRAFYIESFFKANAIINPLSYLDRFDDFKDISLFTFCGTNDFLLDDTISLAKIWKGKVCLDVFDDLIHGFLGLVAISKESTRAFEELVIERFQEACGLI